jgi:hypothetical protein
MSDHSRPSCRRGFPQDARGSRSLHGLAALAAGAFLAVLAVGCASVASPRASEGSAGVAGGSAGPVSGHAPAGGTSVNPAREQPGTGSRSGVTGGALFGGTSRLVPEEGALGRKLAIVRVYFRIGEKFPGPGDRQFMAGGRTLLVSLDTVPGDGPSYAAIAAGDKDAVISAFLKAVNRAAVQYHLGAIYICFEHEADNRRHLLLGSPAEFIRAWDHIHQLAVAAHLDWNQGGRLHWVWILEHSAFVPPRALPQWEIPGEGASAYWPGSNEVDIVGVDGYNSGSCTVPGRPVSREIRPASPASLFSPAIAFAQAHGGLPVFIAEWAGTSYALPGVQAEFIHMMQAYVTVNREIAAALYWDGGQGGRCGYGVNGRPASVAALAAMGQSPALQGQVVPAS